MPSSFQPSALAHYTTAVRNVGQGDTNQPGKQVLAGGRRPNERNPMYQTGAEALLAQPPFLLNRELNETDEKYFVDSHGRIYYLNGEEKNLMPDSDVPSHFVEGGPEDEHTKASRALDQRVLRPPKNSARYQPFPERKAFGGHNQTVSSKFTGSQRGSYGSSR